MGGGGEWSVRVQETKQIGSAVIRAVKKPRRASTIRGRGEPERGLFPPFVARRVWENTYPRLFLIARHFRRPRPVRAEKSDEGDKDCQDFNPAIKLAMNRLIFFAHSLCVLECSHDNDTVLTKSHSAQLTQTHTHRVTPKHIPRMSHIERYISSSEMMK